MDVRIGRVGMPVAAARAARRSAAAASFHALIAPADEPAAPPEGLAVGAGPPVAPAADDPPVAPAADDDHAACAQAGCALDALRALQVALLSGKEGQGGMAALACLAQSVPNAADPGLQSVLHDIRVRAAVERARRAPASG